MQFKNKSKLLALALSGILLFSSCGLAPQKEEELAPPIKPPEKVEYQTETVKKGEIINRMKGSCTAISKMQYNLSFTQRGGYLKTIDVKMGDYVEKGAVIATLDTDTLEKDLKIKRIQKEKAQMEIDKIISDAKAALMGAEAELNAAKAIVDDLTPKRDQLSNTSPEYAALSDEIHKNNLIINEKGALIPSLQEKTNPSKNFDVQYKNQDMKILQLELDDLEATLTKSQIVAPQSGNIVYIENIAVGDYVAALKTVVRLADPSDLVMEYRGGNANKIKLGMPVTIKIGENTYPGEVVSTPQNVPMELLELNKDAVLFSVPEMPKETKLGAFGDYEIIIEQKQDVLVVPKRAVVQYVGSYYARVLVDGIRSERSIEIGIASTDQYEVVSGLQEGDVLILE